MDKALINITRNALKELHAQMKSLGFRDRLVGAVKFYIEYNPLEKFILPDRYRTEFEKVHYTLHFERNKKDSYDLKSYDVMLRIAQPVPAIIVKEINAGELDKLMKKYDWAIDQHTMDTVSERMQTKSGGAELKEIETVMNGINKLYNNVNGKDAAEKLMFKYSMDTPYESNTFSLDHLRERYEFNLTAHVEGAIGMTRTDAYDYLKSTVAPGLMNTEELPENKMLSNAANSHVISDEALDKAETALRNGNNWMVFDKATYFLDKDDLQFFPNEQAAKEFAYSHSSGQFNVMPISFVRDLFEKIPYGFELNQGAQLLKENNLYNLKTNVMNQQNLDYLIGNIKLTGFGENLNADLEKNLKEGKDDFQLFYKAEINKKPFEATLNFGKSEKSDRYFFNSYHASLEKNNKEKVEQTFYLNKGKGVTAKEAFNLLDGRAVHKNLTNRDGEPYKGWLQLDFKTPGKSNNFEVKQYHENYGFDLKAALSEYNIKEMKDPEKEKQLMQSLERGNIQSVTLEKDGTSHKMFMEANPQFKTVNLYDGHMKRVLDQSVDQSQSNKADQKKDLTQGENQDPSKKNSWKNDSTSTGGDSKQMNGKTVKELLPQREDTVAKGMRV